MHKCDRSRAASLIRSGAKQSGANQVESEQVTPSQFERERDFTACFGAGIGSFPIDGRYMDRTFLARFLISRGRNSQESWTSKSKRVVPIMEKTSPEFDHGNLKHVILLPL